MSWPEVLGYVASLLIVVSMTMSSVVRLRVLNMAGGALFSLYGALIGAYPVMVLNAITASVNLVYLLRIARSRSTFELLTAPGSDDPYLARFLAHHGADIARFFPEFDPASLDGAEIVFVLRDLRPAGLVVWHREGARAVIDLDYAAPRYRDLRCGRFFLDEAGPRLAAAGCREFAARTADPRHRRYLRRIGFRHDPGRGEDWYRRPTVA